MEEKMEAKEKLRKIKDNFDDFSVEVMKISLEVKRKEDDALSTRIQDTLEDIFTILLSIDYDDFLGKTPEDILKSLDCKMAILSAFLDISLDLHYITQEKFDVCQKFIEEYTKIISK